MNDDSLTPDGEQGFSLPDCPELALFIGSLFQKLGGRLTIDNGQHFVTRPEASYFRLADEDLPQLTDAKPWERFQSRDEWRGALKLLDYWLARLSPDDENFVFSVFAPVSLSADGNFDFPRHL